MPSLHQPTLETSTSLADQLRQVSWTEGFASASQPLPASPYHRFIGHQAIGVRIESQFWESPFFGLLQQISQVLLILAFFSCLGLFFWKIITLVCSIICTQFCQMMAALTMVARWFGMFPVRSSANAASRARTALQIQALSRLHCITLTPCIDIGFGAMPHFFK